MMHLRSLSYAIILGLIGTLFSFTPPAKAASTQPDYGQSLTLAEQRTLAANNKALARKLGLREATIQAITVAVGRGTPRSQYSFARLIADVGKLAQDAKEWEAKYNTLYAEVSAINDAAIRTPAQAILGRAKQAFDNGDLAKAEATFGELAFLRNAESEKSYAAWIEAVQSQAKMANLQLNEDRAKTILLEAAGKSETAERAIRIGTWQLSSAAARNAYAKGDRLGLNDALDTGVALYSDRVLPLVPKDKYPTQWADTQNAMGVVLMIQGQRLAGEAGSKSLARAVSAFEAALTVHNRDSSPVEWANIQLNLASTLVRQAKRKERDTGLQTLVKAVAASRAALTVLTKESEPSVWASAHVDLGSALLAQSERMGSEAADALLSDSINSYKIAIAYFSDSEKEGSAANWAAAQHGLGNAYFRKGEMLFGAASIPYFRKAVEAYEEALSVYHKDFSPPYWASVKLGVAHALFRQGQNLDGDAGMSLLVMAVAAYEAAQSVFDEKNFGDMASNIAKVLKQVRSLIATRRVEVK